VDLLRPGVAHTRPQANWICGCAAFRTKGTECAILQGSHGWAPNPEPNASGKSARLRWYQLARGDPAPSFSLPAFPAGTAALNDYLGKHKVLLFFYFGDFTASKPNSGDNSRQRGCQFTCAVFRGGQVQECKYEYPGGFTRFARKSRKLSRCVEASHSRSSQTRRHGAC